MITDTQQNFCRLTGMSADKYQNLLFEQGCTYVEWYFTYCGNAGKALAQVMLYCSCFWKWWATQWNIRTQEAFNSVAVKEDEQYIEPTAVAALLDAFYNAHDMEAYIHVYPNRVVFKQFNEKIKAI